MEHPLQVIAVHEAGHAVGHFVLGRRIESCQVMSPTLGATTPEPGTALGAEDEAVLWRVGWTAEREFYRWTGMADDQIDTKWMNGGTANDDWNLDHLVNKHALSESVIEQRAEELVLRHWTFILAVADALLPLTPLDQQGLSAIAGEIGAQFGQDREVN